MKSKIKLILSFLLFEIKEVSRLFFSTGKKALIISSGIIFITLLTLVISDAYSHPGSPSSNSILTLLFEFLIMIGISIIYSIPIALIAGFFRIIWRQCGILGLVPVIIIPLTTFLVIYLLSGYLIDEATEVLMALATSAKTHG